MIINTDKCEKSCKELGEENDEGIAKCSLCEDDYYPKTGDVDNNDDACVVNMKGCENDEIINKADKDNIYCNKC